MKDNAKISWVLDEKETSSRTNLKNDDILGREGSLIFPHLPEMSRKHCKIIIHNDLCFLEDLGSKNGTIVDGVICLPNIEMPVRDGAKVSFGGKDVIIRKVQLSHQTQPTMTLMLEDSPLRNVTPDSQKVHILPAMMKTPKLPADDGKGELVSLLLKNFIYTVLTLGIYAPWARSNIREHMKKSSEEKTQV